MLPLKIATGIKKARIDILKELNTYSSPKKGAWLLLRLALCLICQSFMKTSRTEHMSGGYTIGMVSKIQMIEFQASQAEINHTGPNKGPHSTNCSVSNGCRITYWGPNYSRLTSFSKAMTKSRTPSIKASHGWPWLCWLYYTNLSYIARLDLKLKCMGGSNSFAAVSADDQKTDMPTSGGQSFFIRKKSVYTDICIYCFNKKQNHQKKNH